MPASPMLHGWQALLNRALVRLWRALSSTNNKRCLRAGVLPLLYRSSLRPRAVLWWPLSAPIACVCAAFLAYYDVRWLCDSCINLLDRVGMAPVANGIQSSLRFTLAGVGWMLSMALRLLAECFSAGARMLAYLIQVCLRWVGHGVAFSADALISSRESWVSRAINAAKTKLQGELAHMPWKCHVPLLQLLASLLVASCLLFNNGKASSTSFAPCHWPHLVNCSLNARWLAGACRVTNPSGS